MKIQAIRIVLLTALLYTSTLAPGTAQTPVSGYWVVETNQHTKDHTVVKFYDADDQLVYEEQLEGVHLDVTRRKTVKLLNQTLQRVMSKSLISDQISGEGDSAANRIAKKRS